MYISSDPDQAVMTCSPESRQIALSFDVKSGEVNSYFYNCLDCTGTETVS